MKSFALLSLFVALALSPSAVLAAGAAQDNSASSKPASVAEQLQALASQAQQQQKLLQQQQQQIQQLQQQNADLQKQYQQQQQSLQSTLQRANDSVTTTQQDLSSLHTTVSDLQTNTKATAEALLESKKSVSELENPVALRYKGITITPGGYLEGSFFVRSRNENADLNSNFGSSPFTGSTNANMSEFRMTARGSRIALTAQGNAGTAVLTGYYEVDFLGQAPTANYVQTNSFTPRMRQLWAQGELKSGTTFSVGQFWSLMTTDRKGIALRSEFIPSVLESGYLSGYTYVRQDALRATHDFNNKVWIAGEVGNGETSQPVTSFTPPNVMGFNNSPNALSPNGSTLNFLAGSATGLSTAWMPDVMAKVAFEPGYGHYELKGLVRMFRDRYNGSSNYTAGGGLGWGVILPLQKNKVDFIFEGLAGRGIGRYGAANQADVTVNPLAKVITLPEVHSLIGLEYHPNPKMDINLYFGDQYIKAEPYTTKDSTGKVIPAGYGSHLVDNRACFFEVAPVVNGVTYGCTGQNKNIGEGVINMFYRIHKGPFGIFQYGVQYEYFWRNTYSGIGGAPAGHDNVVLNSFRYILP